MMKRVFLTVTCFNLNNPRHQRARFDQAIQANNWVVAEHTKADQKQQLVSTETLWYQDFTDDRPTSKIVRQTTNLIHRSAEFAGIKDFDATLQFQDTSSIELFNHGVQT